MTDLRIVAADQLAALCELGPVTIERTTAGLGWKLRIIIKHHGQSTFLGADLAHVIQQAYDTWCMGEGDDQR